MLSDATSIKTNSNKDYPAIDWIKLVFAFVITGIHTGGLSDCSLIHMGFGVFSRLAVPAFFAISGFLFFRKSVTSNRLFQYIKRCGILYIVFSIFFFLEDVVLLQNTDAISFLIVTLKQGFRHLWFLYALMIGVSLLALVDRFIRKKSVIVVLAVCLLVIGYLINTYGSVLGIGLDDSIVKLGVVRALVEAFPPLAAGLLLARQQSDITVKQAMLGAFISFVLLGIESYIAITMFHVTSTVCWLFTLPCVYFVLAFGTSIKCNKSSMLVRKSTTLIYLIHPCFVLLFTNAKYGSGLTAMLLDPFGIHKVTVFYVIVSLLTIISVLIVYFSSKTRYGKCLNYIM